MSKDDQDWLDALAGKPNADADPATNRRAAALRASMLALRKQETALEPPGDGLERLLFRLRSEGLLGKQKQPWRLRLPTVFALAASVLFAVGLGAVFFTKKQELVPLAVESSISQPIAVRSASSAQTLFADNPEELASDIKRDFSAVKITFRKLAVGKNIYLDADLPENLSAEALQVFDQYRLSIPYDRKLVIEIRQQAAP